MLLEQPMARLLGSIAFLGLWEGCFARSEAIFQAIRAARPEHCGASLGLALAFIHQGRHAEAVRLLEKEVLPLAPDDPHAQCWLGLALHLDGKAGRARSVLRSVLDADPSGRPGNTAAALADSILADMDDRKGASHD